MEKETKRGGSCVKDCVKQEFKFNEFNPKPTQNQQTSPNRRTESNPKSKHE